ncbi:MAG: tetratricopeptide repeat protein [Gammaproteobacteria bacterium]|nr:tetratricopeptide repeat protein [Gammaproteobacteria bacterium]
MHSVAFTLLVLHIGLSVVYDSGFFGSQAVLATSSVADPRPQRTVPTMSAETYEKLAEFSEILIPTDDEGNPLPLEEVGERDLSAGQEILDNLLARHWRLNGNEKAQVHRNYAWLAQELDDMDLAIEHLVQILDYRESISYVLEEQTLNNLSKLHFVLGKYEEAIDYSTQFMARSTSEDPNDYAYIAQVYYALKDFHSTKDWIERAIASAEEQSTTVKKAWREILLAAENQLGQNDDG